ncbi:MAG: hypothetical protein ACOX3H_06700 [Saccharofermentanales bacterium]|jgi:hypothetical protein
MKNIKIDQVDHGIEFDPTKVYSGAFYGLCKAILESVRTEKLGKMRREKKACS